MPSAMHRKPHVSKSRSSRSLQAAAANQAAAWSQHSQHRMSVLNQTLADLDKQPGPAIMTGAGFPQHSPSQPEMTDAAPVDTALPPFIHDSQLLYGGHEGSEPSRAAEALSGSQLQNVTVGLLPNPAVHSTAIHSSNTGNEDSKAHQVRDLGSATSRAWTEKDSQTPGDIWSQPLAGPHVTGAADAAHLTRATRTLSQQSATNSATDQPHVEHDHAAHSDAVGLPLAAAGRNGRPLLNSSKRRADSAWSLRGLWARFWGELACPATDHPYPVVLAPSCPDFAFGQGVSLLLLCFCQAMTSQKPSAFTTVSSWCNVHRLGLTSRTMPGTGGTQKLLLVFLVDALQVSFSLRLPCLLFWPIGYLKSPCFELPKVFRAVFSMLVRLTITTQLHAARSSIIDEHPASM